MGTLTDAVNTLVTNTTSLQTTVSGRITDMDGKIASADTAKVAAEAAKAGAEVAKSLADTAKTDAQTAQTLAQNAKDSAETAQGIAATAKTDALVAKAATDTAKANAITAKDAALAAETSAQNWASKTSGAVSGGEMSAKYHAQTASTDAGTATTKAAAASTSEGNALASKNTATTKATAAGTSATSASSSASAASSSATAASGSASTATTKASDAAGSATASASSATAASGSAGTAATKATAANTSANAAASSASTAASTLANKLDKTGDGSQLTGIDVVARQNSAPTSPANGDLWYNTDAESLYCRVGGSWVIAAGKPSLSALSGSTSGSVLNFGGRNEFILNYDSRNWVGIFNIEGNSGTNAHFTSAWWDNSTGGTLASFFTSQVKTSAYVDLNGIAYTKILIITHQNGTILASGEWDILAGYKDMSMGYLLNNTANNINGTKITGQRVKQLGSTPFINNTAREGNSSLKCEFTDSVGGRELRINWNGSGSNSKYTVSNDTLNYNKLTTGLGAPEYGHEGYEHTFSGIGGHHERPPGQYVYDFDFAPYFEYCGTSTPATNNSNRTCSTETIKNVDVSIFFGQG